MLRVSGTVNQIPVKIKHMAEFVALLNRSNIPYILIGGLMGYSVFEFQDKADTSEALHLRDTLYKTNKL